MFNEPLIPVFRYPNSLSPFIPKLTGTSTEPETFKVSIGLYDTETFGANTKLGLTIPAYISANVAVTLASGLTTNLSFNSL